MKVYRTIILNEIDTFSLWVALANLGVKCMQCHNCAAFHLLVNDIPRVRIQGPNAITSFGSCKKYVRYFISYGKISAWISQ